MYMIQDSANSGLSPIKMTLFMATIERADETDVADSNVFCIFGSSLGETDKYVWCEVGQRLLSNKHTFLVLFVREIPCR